MGRIRVFIILVLAITAGGVLAYGTYSYLQNAPTVGKTATVATQPVVVAATDLKVGVELKADDLKTVEWPASAVPQGTFGKPSDVLGRGLIVPVVQNEAILDPKLAPREAGVGLPPAIPEGMRAVSVRVNDVIGVAGYVLPGTHVDVLATANPTSQQETITTKLVLSNVQVLTAGTKLEQATDKDKPEQVTVVTLLVNPEQAEKLTLASTEGKIQLALRNPLDLTAPPTPGVRPAVLLASGSVARPVPAATRSGAKKPKAAAPAPAPAPDATVEIIRGDKRVVEAVK